MARSSPTKNNVDVMSFVHCCNSKDWIEPRFNADFGREAEESLPELWQLEPLGMRLRDQTHWRLTDEGMSHSDVIGPWLYSPEVTQRMQDFIVV